MSQLSKRFYLVASDPSLNPWRRPIKRNLSNSSYEKELKHLSVRTTVPRHNWVEILASASPSFILYEATLPHLQASEWEDCFKRRFLPSWAKWKKESSWKEAYLKFVLNYLPSSDTTRHKPPILPLECYIVYGIVVRAHAQLMNRGPSSVVSKHRSQHLTAF